MIFEGSSRFLSVRSSCEFLSLVFCPSAAAVPLPPLVEDNFVPGQFTSLFLLMISFHGGDDQMIPGAMLLGVTAPGRSRDLQM